MKRLAVLLVFALITTHLLAQNSKLGSVIKIASYNIQYDNLKDKINSWEKRLPGVVMMFEKYDFDIVGAQEPYLAQLQDLMPKIPSYAYLGINILGDTGTVRRHYTPILYKKDKFEVLDWGTFWYSENPDDAGKKGWDAYSARICTWAKFKNKHNGQDFFFFNSHFDHIGDVARRESPKLLLAKIKERAAGYPVFATGDFNTNQYHSNYKILSESQVLKDSYDIASKIRNRNTTTFNGYKAELAGDNRIDHVYVSSNPKVKVNSYKILTESFKGVYPSDHFPVFIEAELPNQNLKN